MKRVIFALLVIVSVTSTSTGTQYFFEVPLGGVCLNGSFPITITTASGSVTGTLETSINPKGAVSGQLLLGGVSFAVTGTYKATTKAVVLSLSAANGKNKIKLIGTLQGTEFAGTTKGSGSVASGKGTFILDVSGSPPLVADVNVDLVTSSKGALSGTGTVTLCGWEIPVTAKGKTSRTFSLSLKGGAFSWSGSGSATNGGYSVSWNGKGFGASARGANLPLVGLANSMLAGATTYDGEFPSLSTVVYPTKSGDTLTLTVAYAGFVDVYVNPITDVATVLDTIEANGGTVVAAVPAAGLFLVQIPVGQEAVFLAAMYAYPWVEDGSPASPAVQGAIRVMDWDDSTNANLCGALHMTYVSTVAGRLGGAVSETDIEWEARDAKLPQTLLRRMEMDEILGRRTVYNLSLQSGSSGSVPSTLDRTGCTEGYCRTIRHQQILFYRALFSGMEEMAQKNPDALNNSVVTIIAGNAGIDLDNELAALKYRFPNAFKHVVIVGGTDAAGNIDTKFNHLADNSVPNMVYARGRGVHVGTNSCDGTSFAGPEISAVLDYIWSHNPTLTSDQVVNAFKQALANLGTNNVVPQDSNGFTTKTFLDQAVALAGECTYSISSTNASVGSGSGSGSFSVTTLDGCGWTASSDSGWLHTSSSNTGSGKVSYTYDANPDTGPRTGHINVGGQTFTVTQTGVGVTGTWNGTLNMPGASYSGCEPQTTSFSLSLNEDAGMNITGSTSNSRTISSGSHSGNSITVTLSTMFGSRGPYTWVWNGTDTITGSMAYFCYDLSTGALLSEGTETFTVTRINDSLTKIEGGLGGKSLFLTIEDKKQCQNSECCCN